MQAAVAHFEEEEDSRLVFDFLDFQCDIAELEADSRTGETTEESTATDESSVTFAGKKRSRPAEMASVNVRKAPRGGPVQRRQSSINLEVILENQALQPTHSRQQPRLLQAFPSFDKCDSLLFFAHKLTRTLNSMDYVAANKFISSHTDRSCRVNMNNCRISGDLSCRTLVRLFEVGGDLQPDRIMCVHSTKVVENHIHSVIYMKFTDVKFLYDCIVPGIRDPKLRLLWAGLTRSEALRRKIIADNRPTEEVEQLAALVDTGNDLTVNMRLDLRITFDHYTKKVTELDWRGRLLSLYPAETVR